MNKKYIPLIIASVVTGCGPLCEIPPAHVGKINTSGGLQEGIIPPSSIRLNMAILPGSIPDKLIIAEAGDYQIKESMVLFMPKDKLNLTIEVRGIVSISPKESNANKIFSRIKPQQINDRIGIITGNSVYGIYGQNTVREVVRSVLSNYNIDSIMANREALGIELFKKINSALAETPLVFSSFGLADIQPPDIIVKAQEATKEKEVLITKAEAQKQISLAEADAALEVAKKNQERQLLEAETQAAIDKVLSKSVNSAYISQRALTIWEQISTNTSKTLIFVPSGQITDSAYFLGAIGQINNSTNR